jgi:hypothetical protein
LARPANKEGEEMASGSFAGSRKYVKKLFDLESLFGRFTDRRAQAIVPLVPMLITWFWGMSRRLPSTEQVGDMLADKRWRRRVGLKREQGGSPDTAGRVLDETSVEEWNEFVLQMFFLAHRAGLLREAGPFGLRCAIVDLNELFCSEKRHCPDCQVRHKHVVGSDGEKREVEEYYHQAVALVWANGTMAWPLGWELLQPGEGELTAALRLLARLLPRLRGSLDLVMGDSLYCCRPFFELVCGAGLQALAIGSGQTEMDEEMNYLMRNEQPHQMLGQHVDIWEMESEAWARDVGRKLRVLHYERRYEAPPWKHERQTLRIMTSVPVQVVPSGHGWKVGRCRFLIENATFNVLTRDHHLTHNYHHSPTAIVALLALRSVARAATEAYRLFATARSQNPPRDFLRWFQDVFIESWFAYLRGCDESAEEAAA